MPESRDHRQDRALVMLLQALPQERLERILLDLGLTPEKVAGMRRDTRRCDTCGLGYPLCRERWEDDHEWTPKPSTAAPRPPDLKVIPGQREDEG